MSNAIVSTSDRLAREVLARREVEEELADTRERLAAIVRGSTDAIVMFEETGTIEFVNPAAVKMFAEPRDELIGHKVGHVVDLPDDWRSMVDEDTANGSPLQVVRADGTVFSICLSLSHMTVNGRDSYAAILRDQTHVQRLERKFVKAQRLEAAGALAAGVAHDFNNILMGINGTVALAEREADAGHRVHERLAEIREAVDSAAAISRQLLAFTRRPSSTGRLFSVDAVTLRTRKLLQASVGDNVNLKFDLRAAGLHVAGDRGHLEQAVLNLVINARDAIQGKGEVTVETRAVELREPLHRFDRTLPEGHYVRVSVVDTGAGIPPEHVGRIFEPFYTTKRLGHGTGLGLSMVYGTARSMGGLIEVESTVGEGTRFDILLPAIVGIDPSLEEPISTGEFVRAATEPLTVLVVEDNPLVARTVGLYLESDEHTVHQASSVAAAEQFLRERGDEVELVLCDAVLSDGFGADVARVLQEQRPAVDIVFMSAHPRGMLLDLGRILPGHDYLHKPFEPVALKRLIVERQRSAKRPARTTGRVMVVDDHAPSAVALEVVLRDAGYTVSVATSCEEARTRWRSQPVDILVTDLRLPDGSGGRIAREFRLDNPKLHVVYASGLPREASEAEHQLLPDGEYIEKPFDIDELCFMLQGF